jgi:hypothetical protein
MGLLVDSVDTCHLYYTVCLSEVFGCAPVSVVSQDGKPLVIRPACRAPGAPCCRREEGGASARSMGLRASWLPLPPAWLAVVIIAALQVTLSTD